MQHQYQTLDQYLKKRFGKKIFKVALNGDFNCPNRDGTISNRGCIFCSEMGSGDFAGDKTTTLHTQFESVSTLIHQKWPEAGYIVYFQANTNTYAPLERLKTLYEEAIQLHPNIVAISIATRPDALNDDIIQYLGELNQRIPVWIELGLQTIYDQTAELINRGYARSVFDEAVKRLREHQIEVIVHIINGLPYETNEMMINTIRYLNDKDIQGIKIHALLILKNTELGNNYLKNPFELMTLEAYAHLVSEQIAWMRPDIIVHRISGDASKESLIAPLWTLKKFVVMNEIDKIIKQKNYYQGCKIK